MKDLRKIIGRRIAAERKKQGLSQEKLAELAGSHRTYIGLLERGELNIGICNLAEVAKALNYPLESLFKDL
ncbi:MAG: helix-turn-helix transcriptional regulator [Candidatus Gastranaerophilales bacterium]|nr:helix-turn-helix transcriptional regulator [Candidatus Gastranaerophilales bacterium]